MPSELFHQWEYYFVNQRVWYITTERGYMSYIMRPPMAAPGSDEIWTIIVGSFRKVFCAGCVLILEFLKKISSFIDRTKTFVLTEISIGNKYHCNFNTHLNIGRLFSILLTFGISFNYVFLRTIKIINEFFCAIW